MDSGACNGSIPNFGYRLNLFVVAMGAFLSPLVYQFLMSKGIPWQRFYLGSLVLSGINLVFLVFAYYPTRSEFDDDRIQALDAATNIESPSRLQSLRTHLPSPSVTQSSSIHASVPRPHLQSSEPSTFARGIVNLIEA